MIFSRRWGRPALFLTALFLAMMGSRDMLLRPLFLLVLGPEGTGRIMAVAWNLPSLLVLPLAYLSDRVPRRESRRELHLLFAGSMSVAAWASLFFVPLAVGSAKVLALVLGCAAAAITVSVRGALGEAARRLTAPGRLAAGLVAVQAASALFELPVLRHLMERPLECAPVTGTVLGLVSALLVGGSLVARRAGASAPSTLRPARALLDYLQSRAFWALLALGVLVALATPDDLLYSLRPTDTARIAYELRLEVDFLGKVARLVAAVAYAIACRRLAPRILMPSALVFAALGACALFASTGAPASSFVLALAANQLGHTLPVVALMDLAFRAAPAGHEAFAFTLTAFAPGVVAPAVQARWFAHGLASSTNIAISLGGLALALAATRLVPAALRDRPDGPAGDGAATRT